MDNKHIVKFCKDLGCCDTCCIRYLGLKNPSAYKNVHQFILKYLEPSIKSKLQNANKEPDNNILIKDKTDIGCEEVSSSTPVLTENISKCLEPSAETSPCEPDDGSCNAPPAKRIKLDNVCVSCLGVLQEETWPESLNMVKEALEKKCYECESLACALSSPIAAMLRERAISLRLEDAFPAYEHKTVMPLKEAWKWSFGQRMAEFVGKQLDSGAVAPLLVTLNIEYPDDLQELEVLKSLAPTQFPPRGGQRRRAGVEFSRRPVEQALAGVSLAALAAQEGWGAGMPPARAPARAVSVLAAHSPLYLGGRYIKLSRVLPQTPWLVGGRRMLHSSVQEIIFEPVASSFGLGVEEAERLLKFISAGREDVDVRCLGTGRPFALEITDPRRQPSATELQRVCELISASGKVIVKSLVPVTREDLTQLKQGEESKCKSYEALCIKLEHTESDRTAVNGSDAAPAVTERDLRNVNAFRNTAAGDAARVLLSQRTPVRVLHRRPLHARARRIYELSARAVPGRPALFVVRVRTEAGTYIKEWAHGELRRTRPALGDALGARADILALDVADVELPWPPAS